MIVRPYDPPDRWLVPSESRRDITFLVDLAENNGFGCCACEHFSCHVQPCLDRGEPVAPCKHLQCVRRKFC